MSMPAIISAGVRRRSRVFAPPVSRMIGLPDGSASISMSRQNTPERKPVPSALAHASLPA
jgi:hypothetical protein